MSEIISAILHGVFLALGLIIPLGVQNIFIFNQGASQDKLIKALPSVIAASICDTLLITLAVMGVSLLILQLAWLKLFIFGVGFIFLLYMGYNCWNQTAGKIVKEQKKFSAKKQILFATSVSILNPHAIIDTMVIIGTNSIEYTAYPKVAYTLSCVIISWLWFLGLAIAGRLVKKIDKNGLWVNSINKIAAIIIWIVTVYIGIQLYNDLKAFWQ